MSETIKNRYEFVVLFDIENGNPNGDPDAGNLPRVDSETSHGIVTDVCVKRKIRNYVELVKNDEEYYNILIKQDDLLNSKFKKAYEASGLKTGQKGKDKRSVQSAREFMCKNYYDVRTFGAVMSTGDDPCGIVRGPVQINFARSIDPVFIQEITITRIAVTNEKDAGKDNEMGRKHVVPYALYKTEGYVSALLAQKVTGFNEDDLELLWEAVINMFEHDHSAARGKMTVRRLIVFKHDAPLGNAPAHKLFDAISVERKDKTKPARAYTDYQITVDMDNVPAGVTVQEKL
ncbi:MAG: type I-C CRISPR-associated protein Cas7/Csd2 [Clostridiaceae bacterium]|jgi:CRISPR-associated protein Csd2|nr:type I-C CRISPR-associated protein Cas7/Csd2 [Clostridiaceae bacterium]